MIDALGFAHVRRTVPGVDRSRAFKVFGRPAAFNCRPSMRRRDNLSFRFGGVICQEHGFQLIAEEAHHSFGHALTGQTWRRDL
ncbi:hypothetical protein [Streptomyces sp. NPDC059819]|uniref:hypothetical protein n=1 Tax=Streptomyces sp. NPDC059819 TaxID=3346963 RepID=UPI00364EF117